MSNPSAPAPCHADHDQAPAGERARLARRLALRLAIGIATGALTFPRAAGAREDEAASVVVAKTYHLGVAGRPEWDEFAGRPPDARELDLPFEARANAGEATLLIRQADVKQAWEVRLNGRKVGQLHLMEA